MYGDRDELIKLLKRAKKDFNHFSPGWVYLLGSELGYYKIGKTINPKERFKTFAVKLPFEVHLIHKFYAFDRNWVEQYLHASVAKLRVSGEWFKLPDDRIEMIKSIPNDYGALDHKALSLFDIGPTIGLLTPREHDEMFNSRIDLILLPESNWMRRGH
jgi:hypothetical protein